MHLRLFYGIFLFLLDNRNSVLFCVSTVGRPGDFSMRFHHNSLFKNWSGRIYEGGKECQINYVGINEISIDELDALMTQIGYAEVETSYYLIVKLGSTLDDGLYSHYYTKGHRNLLIVTGFAKTSSWAKKVKGMGSINTGFLEKPSVYIPISIKIGPAI